jgi:hypothetical protein
LGVIFVGHDEKTAGGIAPEFDGQAFQYVFKMLRMPRFLRSLQGSPRNAQIVRHGVPLRLEVREKRGKRGKASAPFTFPRFSRLFTGGKPALDRPPTGIFLPELNQGPLT